VVRLLVLGTIVGAAGLFYLTRPSTLVSIILPRATKAIGGPVAASKIALDGFDTLVLEDVRIRVDGWEGDTGQLAYADRVHVEFSPWELFIGKLTVRAVSVNRLELRLAERANEPNSFSLLDLRPDVPTKDDSADDKLIDPPAVTIEELVIENGIADNDRYTRLGELRFRGTLQRLEDAKPRYQLQLTGRPDTDGNIGVGTIKGEFSPTDQALSLEVDDLVVDNHELAIAPIAVREWTRKLSLDGRLKRGRFEYSPSSEPFAEFDVEGVALDLPLDALGEASLEDAWSGFAGGKPVSLKSTPRMTVREGTLRVSTDRVELRGLKGELGARDPEALVIPVPFECAFQLDIPRTDLEPFTWEKRDTWLEEAARIAPFTLTASIPQFSSPVITQGAPDTLQLPTAAVKILSDFNIVQWTIDVDTRFERGSPDKNRKPAPLQSSGMLRLSRCAGAFEEFPYPLVDVSGTIGFEGDNLVVERIVGKARRPVDAPNTANAAETPEVTVSIEGRLDGIASGAEIDLDIRCDDAPIDATLFASFEGGAREALELLFDQRAASGMAKAGLLPDAALLVEQRQQLARLSEDDADRATRERLERSIAAGPFALGGRCGFQMRVYSPAGFGQPIYVTGNVEVRDAGVMFGRFPYPLRIKQGRFQVLDEAIVIGGGGLTATTPAGGVFNVSGSVNIPRDGKGGRDLRPLIEITDKGDTLNPALLAAIPHDGDEIPSGWPGEQLAPGGELLRALGLSGAIELNGLVTSKPDGREDFRFRIAFSGGTAAPDAAGRAWLADEGLPWPTDFTLEECAAQIDIVPERLTFEQCVGRHGSGSVVARGFTDLDGPASSIELELNDLPIDRAFEGYLAADPATAEARFTRYGPSGSMDGKVRRTVSAKGAETEGVLTPDWLEITLDGSRVRADRVAGRIAVSGNALRAESLEFRLSDGNQDDGILRLSGPLSMAATEGSTPLDAQLANCRFESPLVRELLAPRANAIVGWMRSESASGRFDAHYIGEPRESITVKPKSLAAGARDARVEVFFDDAAKIDADAAGVRWNVAGTFAPNATEASKSPQQVTSNGSNVAQASETSNGSVRSVGSVESNATNGVNTLAANLSIDAPQLTRGLRAQLPPPLDSSATAIDLTSAGRFTLQLDEITARWQDQPPQGTDPMELYHLKGAATFDAAAFETGVAFTGMNASLPFSLEYTPRTTTPVKFEARVVSSRATVIERLMGASIINLSTDATGDALNIDGAGDFALGRFDVTARTDFKADRYQVRVRVAGADYVLVRDPARESERTTANAGLDGRVAGVLEVEGPMGSTPEDVAGRKGWGRAAVHDARLADAPIAMRALQLTQLMLPINAALKTLSTSFTIQGDTVDLDTCTLTTGTLTLNGKGKLDIPTFALAMRFFPKGTVPILSDVIGSVTNQLFAIDIRGTLGDPQTSVVAIPAAAAMPTMPPSTSNAATTPPAANTPPAASPPSNPPTAAPTPSPSERPANSPTTTPTSATRIP
jgi:hypothetical protein